MSKRITRNQKKVKKLLNKDYEDWKFKKHFSSSHRDDTYKYDTCNNQEVITGDIPEWAKRVLTDHKPGDTIGKRRRFT